MRDPKMVSDSWVEDSRRMIRGIVANALGYKVEDVAFLVRDQHPLDENTLPLELCIDCGSKGQSEVANAVPLIQKEIGQLLIMCPDLQYTGTGSCGVWIRPASSSSVFFEVSVTTI